MNNKQTWMSWKGLWSWPALQRLQSGSSFLSGLQECVGNGVKEADTETQKKMRIKMMKTIKLVLLQVNVWQP